jgi:alpha-tubulin suppressor-like RCC1 family protein
LALRRHIEKIPVVGQIRRRGIACLAALVALLALGAATLPARGSAASYGQLYGFGDNRYGQLGNTTNNETDRPNPTPTLVTLPSAIGPVIQTATGSFSLALTATGQLYAFGENEDGQLGNETNNLEYEPNPTPTPVTLPGEGGPVTQVAGGGGFSLVVTSTGQLYAFGNNWWGQLGNATNNGIYAYEANPTPTLVTLPGATGPVTQAAAGGGHSLAVTSSGQLYAFGENFWGQLGNTTNDSENYKAEANPTPALVTLPGAVGPVTQVAAGGNFSLAVTSSGQLYAFGENINGELGNPTNNLAKELKPNPTPTLVTLPGEVGSVAQVAAGPNFTLALTSGDQLYAFGDNRCGELGNATNNRTWAANPTPTLVSLPGASGRTTHIAAGDEYSLALTSTGQLYAFGCDAFGELGSPPGNELLEARPTPRQVALPGDARAETMAAGSSDTLVVLDDLAVANSSLPAGEIGLPYSAQAQGTGGAAPYEWSAASLPPGLSIDPENGAISGTPTAAGTYTPMVTLTDGNGIEAPTPLTLEIKGPSEPPPNESPPPTEPPPAPPHEPPPPSNPTPPAGPQQLVVPPGSSEIPPPPSVQDTRQSAKRWREDNPLAHRGHAKTPAGTTFSFSLNEPATVNLSFAQFPEERRGTRGCSARTDERVRCDGAVMRGTLSFTGHSGTNSVVFAGRISRTDQLKPGRYELTITAVDSTGQRSAPVSLSFTIAK